MRTSVVGRQSSVVRSLDGWRRRRSARWATTAATVLCLGAAVTSVVFAQDSAASATASSAGTACTAPLHPVASVVDTICAATDQEAKHPLPNEYMRVLLRGIIAHFTVPSPLDVPVYGEPMHKRPGQFISAPTDVRKPDSVSVAISAELTFTLKRDGRLADVGLISTSLSSSLDEHLMHAVTEFDSTRVMPPFPADVGGDAVKVFFEVDTDHDSTRVSEPLFVAAMPVWVMGRHAKAKRDNPIPRYPSPLEAGHLNGSVLLSFVVDNTGVPLMATLRLHRTTGREFTKAVLDVLPKWHFDPARTDGCPVAQRVQMPYRFEVE